jgi:hypothetical protein
MKNTWTNYNLLYLKHSKKNLRVMSKTLFTKKLDIVDLNNIFTILPLIIEIHALVGGVLLLLSNDLLVITLN